MIDKTVHSWVEVNGLMDDEYREIVITLALSHLANVSPDLNRLSKETINKTVHINGFRLATAAPKNLLRQHVSAQFKKNRKLASIIISLWSEEEKETIDRLKAEALNANLPVHESWGWTDGMLGYIDSEEIPELYELATRMGENIESPEKDHLILAALWLSRGLFEAENEEAQKTEKENPANTLTPQMVVEDIKPTENAEKSAIEIAPSVSVEKTPEEDVTINKPTLDTTELDKKTIGELSKYWEKQSTEIIGARDSTLLHVEELRNSSKNSDPSEMRAAIKQLDQKIKEWEDLTEKSQELVVYITSRLSRELQLRSDIKVIQPEVSELSASPSENELVAILPTVFDAITKYDKKKSVAINELNTLRKELIANEQTLSLWQVEVDQIHHLVEQLNDIEDLSVQQLHMLVETSKRIAHESQGKIIQVRGLCINRILDLKNKISESSLESEDKSEKNNLAKADEAELKIFSDSELQEMEAKALDLFNRLIAMTKQGESRKVASQLKKEWDDQVLTQLIEALSAEKKDLELLLVELASNAVHPRTKKFDYRREIVKSLISGVSELSTDTSPFLLLSQLAPYFFLGWTSSDVLSRSERCILTLATLAEKDAGLPDGFIWQVETDWPNTSLNSWAQLWQSVILGDETRIYTDQKIIEMQDAVISAQRNMDALFAKDGGHYIRLASVKSDRHRSMMMTHIMPQFQEQYERLSSLGKQFETVRLEKRPKLLGELIKTSEIISKAFSDKKLEELYEKGVYEEKIDDVQPFHAKISARVISEFASVLKEYCDALLKLEELRDSRKDGISYQSLAEELSSFTDQSILTQPALSCVANGNLKPTQQWAEQIKSDAGIHTIIVKLLRDKTCIERFPQAIGVLVNKPFSWDEFLHCLLIDIESPMEIQAAATHLLDKNAANQVLSIIHQIPLDLQKLAQSIHSDQKKRIDDLESEYIKLGGDSAWIKDDQDLGRWGYLSQRLIEETNNLKKKTEEEHQILEDQSLAFRAKINDLDMKILKSKSNIPAEVYKILRNGLNIARNASEIGRLFSPLKDYLDEIEYRLNRESWLETEIESATQNLEKQFSENFDDDDVSMNADTILNALNSGNLSKLGLNPDDFEESKITTRVNVLDNWIALKNTRSILSEKMSKVETNKIISLFSYFARMHQMQHSTGVDGSYMSFEKPIVHEYWQLRYPATPALSKQCIMVALPGNPPTAEDLQILDGFLEKEDFLSVYFVFLFVPGCTPKIAKRLNQNYQKQGLVLIDESALIRMVLAEREILMKPLGKLRPLMLNSTGANADIFTVNQSVSSRTAIFYGRDTLIERIASSGDNYAIYGGRRIGKSSVLKALEQLLEVRKKRVVSYSLEGDTEYSEEYISKRLADLLGIKKEFEENKDLKHALFLYFESNPDENVVLILDEIDHYISKNRDRHILVEALRATSERFEDRFRVIIAGFMELYDCLSGRGPYTPTSNPWGRMLNNDGPLENLKPSDAEKIVQEGFLSILGWSFEHRAIPRRIVERTGGHPAFVQYFCLKLQEQVNKRGDQLVTLKDIDTVFDDNTPEKSFIWFVRKTLEMNLSDPAYRGKFTNENKSDPVSRYLLLWLALDSSTSKTFTFD
ncbi:MAG TPA: AAA family ATPase, partial [Anaerolineales bacterium]|mgnify:FL=1|nr:AAA family ATPase [Anaerolineales bacterium]